MTTNQSLYKAVLDILRKDIRGEAVSVAEFNAILPVVSHEYFIQQYAKFQQTQKITDSLAPFIKTATITLTGGAGSLPVDYMHLIGAPTYSQTVGSATYTREIDVVTRMEYVDRAVDPITQPTSVYPVAIIGSGSISVYPTTITSISITYLCRPVTPKLDYYVTDATNVRTFLSVSATHVADTDAESFPVADSAPGDGDTYTSETVEMEWMPQDRPSILAMIMQKIGVPLGDQMLTSFGMATVQNNDK